MKGEPSLCSSCGNPKLTDLDAFFSGAGSVDKRCVCDFLHIGGQGEVVSDTIQICTKCCKRINEGRAGSFTQWIFRADLCNCEAPVAKTAPLQAIAEAVKNQRAASKKFEEPELAVDPAVFPVERFKPLACLGSGASGTVWKCRDRLLGTKVAVKTLHRLTPTHMMELQQEARIASKLAHPNIVKILDLGLTPDGNPFMVSEYVDGVTLSRLLEERCNLRVPLAINLICQLCDGLDYAHERQIFHRDLKPANLIIVGPDSDEPKVKIVDFGLGVSKRAGQTVSEQGLTIVGTPHYMSPDQISGEAFDSRSECYSVGCILYETICGVLPFKGETPLDIVTKQLNMDPPSLRVLGDQDVSEQLDRIFKRCVAKNPDQRYGFLKELKEELREVQLATTDFTRKPKRIGTHTIGLRVNVPFAVNQTADFTLPTWALIGGAMLLALLIVSTTVLLPWLFSEDGAKKAEKLSLPALKVLADCGNSYAKEAIGNHLLSGDGVGSDPTLAIRYLTEAAHDSPTAQATLGDCYLKGRGVKQNVATAEDWFVKAARVDTPIAERSLGLLSNQRGNIRDAESYFRSAARQGDAVSKDYLAMIYCSQESKENLGTALELFQQSAEAEVVDAQFNCGLMHEVGKGLNQSNKRAIYWYGRAAKNGDQESLYRLGLIYEMLLDLGKAADFYERAAKAGNWHAQLALSRCFATGAGVAFDSTASDRWYQKAMTHGAITISDEDLALKCARRDRFMLENVSFGLSNTLDPIPDKPASSRLAAPSISPLRVVDQQNKLIYGDKTFISNGLCTARDLLALQRYEQVRSLLLIGAEFGGTSLRSLHNKQIKKLTLNSCKINDEVFADIASFGDKFETLELNECSGFTAVGLANIQQLKGLKRFMLSQSTTPVGILNLPTSINDLQIVADLPNISFLRRLHSLKTLAVKLHAIEPSTVESLRSGAQLHLVLDGTGINDSQIHLLKGLQVATIHFDSTNVTDEGLVELVRLFPKVRITTIGSTYMTGPKSAEILSTHTDTNLRKKAFDLTGNVKGWIAPISE